MVSLAGLSAVYPGFQQAQGIDSQNRMREAQATGAETDLAGQQAFGNTLKFFQQQIPGAAPVPGAPEASRVSFGAAHSMESGWNGLADCAKRISAQAKLIHTKAHTYLISRQPNISLPDIILPHQITGIFP